MVSLFGTGSVLSEIRESLLCCMTVLVGTMLMQLRKSSKKYVNVFHCLK